MTLISARLGMRHAEKLIASTVLKLPAPIRGMHDRRSASVKASTETRPNRDLTFIRLRNQAHRGSSEDWHDLSHEMGFDSNPVRSWKLVQLNAAAEAFDGGSYLWFNHAGPACMIVPILVTSILKQQGKLDPLSLEIRPPRDEHDPNCKLSKENVIDIVNRTSVRDHHPAVMDRVVSLCYGNFANFHPYENHLGFGFQHRNSLLLKYQAENFLRKTLEHYKFSEKNIQSILKSTDFQYLMSLSEQANSYFILVGVPKNTISADPKTSPVWDCQSFGTPTGKNPLDISEGRVVEEGDKTKLRDCFSDPLLGLFQARGDVRSFPKGTKILFTHDPEAVSALTKGLDLPDVQSIPEFRQIIPVFPKGVSTMSEMVTLRAQDELLERSKAFAKKIFADSKP